MKLYLVSVWWFPSQRREKRNQEKAKGKSKENDKCGQQKSHYRKSIHVKEYRKQGNIV